MSRTTKDPKGTKKECQEGENCKGSDRIPGKPNEKCIGVEKILARRAELNRLYYESTDSSASGSHALRKSLSVCHPR
jgi:hypothetical protein